MKGSKHLYTPACTAILVFTAFHAQPRCSAVEPVNQHQDQIQPDSAGIFLELLVSSMVFSERLLLQCLV